MHMQDDFPLLLSTLYDNAVWQYPQQEIVSVEADRSIHRTTYAETDVRVRKLATALSEKLGTAAGDAIATFAWNNHRHHELYWATANTGRICHTLNIRLFAKQLEYIVNHAGDKVLFIDPDLAPLIAPLVPTFETVEHVVIMGPTAEGSGIDGAIAYEDLIADVEPLSEWPLLDERSPMMYCYTSGTTGNPKGVAYTQRSTYLHALSNLTANPIGTEDNVLPVVPMFHASAWGYPFMAVTVGAKLTYPGPDLSGEGIVNLFVNERVTFSAGVPSVWFGIQQHLEANPDIDISHIRALFCGGSAVPRSMIDWFEKNAAVRVIQGWGMTETNPVAAAATIKPWMEDWSWEDQLNVLETAGRPIPGLQVKIVDEHFEPLPHDGVAFGELLIRGPWIAAEYFNDPRSSDSFVDGWLRTGDVCKITPDGYIRITDRAKDVIKSGGEWISSLDVENEIMAHPEVAEATVVGLAHPKWQERPAAFVVLREGSTLTSDEVKTFLEPRIAHWWMPDEIIFIDEIPKTGTGKFDKKVVRAEYENLYTGN
ncbi:MAG: 3-(methylthio)propionyl-CoA ligase [Acidimicrobiia bacterium]|nr:MAG: 3-(methylthio)propionyl-CoA ligase [Acidimicrobiia bacterium]